MADQIEQVSERGFGSNLLDSIKGVAIGGLLFIASFWVLWMNEGRVDLSEVAKKALAVSSESIDKGADGKFISVTGELKGEGKLEDPEFLQPGDYITLHRNVEMYAWTEHKSSSKEKKVGGGSKEKVTITYQKEWTEDPKPPAKFEDPKGHENPALSIQSETFTTPKATIGPYSFKATEASLPSGEQLKLTDGMIRKAKADAADKGEDKAEGDKAGAAEGEGDKAKEDTAKKDEAAADDEKPTKKKKGKAKKRHGRKVVRAKPSAAAKQAATDKAESKAAAIADSKPSGYARVNDTYLFRGTGSVDSPEVGDVRISFRALSPGMQVTLFGNLQGSEVQAYVNAKDDVKLFRAIKGSREEAIQTLATEHKTTTWILRLVGFLMMWFGLMLFFGPINALLDVIPFLGSAGRVLIGVVMLPIALLLSSFTVVLSIIFHNTILLILFLAAMGGGGYFLYMQKKKKA